MKPIRIQRKRTKGWKAPANTINVTRPGKWGNPYTVTTDGSIHRALEHFEAMAKLARTEIQQELRGKNLMCWCALNERCHADILLRIANE